MNRKLLSNSRTMKQSAARIILSSVIVLLLASLIIRPETALGGISEWSAETIPSTTNNMLGPAGIDVRDYTIGNDNKTIYAVAGNSILANVTYKSMDAGVTWAALSTPARADMITVAPDDNNIVVMANNSTPELFLSIDSGTTWSSLGTPSPAAGAIIRDITISPTYNGKHYIGVAGRTAGNTAEFWYYPFSDPTPTWKTAAGQPGFTAQSEVTAIAFSPNFAADTTLVAVTCNVSSGVKLQLLNMSSLVAWNTSAAYTGFPSTVITANMTGLVSASLTLSPSYDSTEETSRDLFIGLTLNGDAAAIAASGIYRFRNAVKAAILTDHPIHSVAFKGSYLLAGSYNDTTVYRVQSPLSTSWTVNTYNTYKSPGGENQVLVALMGSTVTAGTGGNESAFSISKDYGATFTDISLIDTVITNARDVAVTASAGKVYFVTDDGIDTSLWYKTANVWTRVFSLKATTDYVVRIERQSGAAVYLTQKGGVTIYYNASSGGAQWQTRTCNLNVQDIAVESTSIVYVLDTTGKITKSTNAGQFWGPIAETTLTSGNMLYSISANKLLAGSQNGYIAYSFNGTSSWTKITEPFDILAGSMQVIPDDDFATNKIIYAASKTAGQDIKKWQIGSSTEWTDIFNGVVTGGIYGLGIDSNTLYALETNAGQSTLWRFISPNNATATSTDWIGIGVTPSTDPIFALNAEPQALKVSASKLWAVKTNGTNKLYSFTDSLTGITITLGQPHNGATVKVNSITGIANDLVLTWQRPSIATNYELRVAQDPDFSIPVTTFLVNSSTEVVSTFVGPNQGGSNFINFVPGITYYWKVRTTMPGYSLFSEVRSFSIDSLPVLPSSSIQASSPADGVLLTDDMPVFSWQPVQKATEYQFILSEHPDMSSPLLDVKTETTAFQISRGLERGKTYFWRLRSTEPIISDWSPIRNFMIAEIVLPPVITKTTPPTFTVSLPTSTLTEMIFPPPIENEPEEEVPVYLLVAIILGTALTFTIVFLILKHPNRTKVRVTNAHIPVRQPNDTLSHSITPRERPLSLPELHTLKPPPQKSTDATIVISAVKRFKWIRATETGTLETNPDKERSAMGEKTATSIRELSKKETLYVQHPEDAAMMLRLWAQYGSRDETNKYLTDSLKSGQGNAVKLIKCFLHQPPTPETSDEIAPFNQVSYEAIAEVVDTDEVYAALTNPAKIQQDVSKESDRITPEDSNIISQFIRLHLQKLNTG
jgi:hypothetical protein